jgi:hypothetical protein
MDTSARTTIPSGAQEGGAGVGQAHFLSFPKGSYRGRKVFNINKRKTYLKKLTRNMIQGKWRVRFLMMLVNATPIFSEFSPENARNLVIEFKIINPDVQFIFLCPMNLEMLAFTVVINDNDIFENNFFTIEFPIQFKLFDSLKLPEYRTIAQKLHIICGHACFGVLRLVSAAWYTFRYVIDSYLYHTSLLSPRHVVQFEYTMASTHPYMGRV